MDTTTAAKDLQYIREVMERTRRRIDTHAFHFVHWGAIVAVWYPLMNWFEIRGDGNAAGITGIASLLVGFALSGFFEWRLSRHPRLPGEDTFVSHQVSRAVSVCLSAAGVMTIVAPSTHFIDPQGVAVIWGLAYANMTFIVGVVYSKEYYWSAGAIFLACLAAMGFPEWSGYILGPVMGLGLLIPGLRAELRVRAMAREESVGPAA